jgi:molybdopterin-guanine dinucleotide biosynthesis protein A
MQQNGIRGVHQWLRGFSVRDVMFDASHFRNLNTRDDLHQAFQPAPFFGIRPGTP